MRQFGRCAGQEAGGVDDCAFVSAFADLFVSIEGFDAEDQSAAAELDQLGANADLGAEWAGGQMADVDVHADGGLIGG